MQIFLWNTDSIKPETLDHATLPAIEGLAVFLDIIDVGSYRRTKVCPTD